MTLHIFVKNKDSVIKPLNTFDRFPSISGLKTNKSRCKIAGIGVPKGFKVAIYRLKYLNLENKIDFQTFSNLP